jgi:hypothetical protein
LTYRHITKTNIKSFETSRILNMINDEKLTDEKKLEIFNESFSSLTNVTIDLISDSIFKIITNDGEVTDKKFISDFINNADKDIFQKIQDHLSSLKKNNDLKPLEFTSTPEQQENGAPPTYTMPISFNNADVFV